MQLTEAQVLNLAPDDASQKAGRGLATPKKWVTSGANEQALWGECQGSGSKPYRTSIDFSDMTTKCSCPSRKFPCKHALGLMLVFVSQPAHIKDTEPPAWVAEWLESRQGRKQAKKEKEDKPADPEQQAKRQQARENKVQSGIEELRVWLSDLVHAGLAQISPQTHKDRENMERRLIDAQAPGLARMVRNLNFQPHSPDYPNSLMRQIGDLFLLLQAFDRLDTLPDLLQADVRTAIGFTQDQKALLEQPGTRDDWMVIGQRVELDDRLWSRQTWLYGLQKGQYALLLDYVHGNPTFSTSYLVGSVLDAEVVHFPGRFPVRALVKNPRVMLTDQLPEALPDFKTLLDQHAEALNQNPWLQTFPVLLSGVAFHKAEQGSEMTDQQGHQVPHVAHDQDFWTLLALSGGHPITVFGLYGHGLFQPISVLTDEGVVSLKGGQA